MQSLVWLPAGDPYVPPVDLHQRFHSWEVFWGIDFEQQNSQALRSVLAIDSWLTASRLVLQEPAESYFSVVWSPPRENYRWLV